MADVVPPLPTDLSREPTPIAVAFEPSAVKPGTDASARAARDPRAAAGRQAHPLVSAVIPSYNRAHVIGRAIDSVRRQTYRRIEIIVVDDGSTDDTVERIGRMSAPGLTYCRCAINRGAAEARNQGISLARGEYIAFLDADDEWLPEKTEHQVAKFEDGPAELGVVYCGYRAVSPDWPPTDTHASHRGDIFETLRIANVVRTSGAMVRRRVLKDVGGFDSTLGACEDLDLWLKIARTYAFDYVPEIAVQYHYGAPDQLSYRSRAVFLSNAVIFKRYGGRQPRAALSSHLALQARELLALGKRRLAARYATRSLLMQPSQPFARRVLKQLIKSRLVGGRA